MFSRGAPERQYSYMTDDCISGTMLHGRAPPLEREDRGGPAAAPSASPNWLRLCTKADRLAAFGNIARNVDMRMSAVRALVGARRGART